MTAEPELTIRRANVADLFKLVNLNAAMALETENVSLDLGRLTRGTRVVLESADNGFYLVGEVGGQIVGSLLITTEWSDWRNGNFWWVQSVYVRSEWRRRGVYRAMHHWLYNSSRYRPDVCGIRLYVHRENRIAQSTYASLGMARSQYDLFEIDFVLRRSASKAD